VATRPLKLVTLEGYAVEGGFDRPYEPATCFSPTIALGRHSGPGVADELWTDFERVLDVASEIGLDGIRLTLEWARIEPRQGRVNETALERYCDIVRYAKSKGLHVTVAIVGAVWPAWLGLEAWLLPWVAHEVVRHATMVVRRVGELADGFVVFSDADGLVTSGYVEGSAPPWRPGAATDASFATRQLLSITQQLSEDPLVGSRLVTDTVTVDLESDEFYEARVATGVREVHVRSLVKGAGPTAARTGLLAKHNGEWTVVATSEVLDALR
jgi:beta-glucosidase/6-phospho-beta-glucosidase/beta-galactosidase